jgi:general secretion pathway protein K
MLAVITAVAICLVIVNEFGTSTTIDMMQSRNNLDQMRAHFLARSSLNITELIVRLQRRLDNAPQQMAGGPFADFAKNLEGVQITEFADPLMAAFGGDAEQVQAAVGPLATKSKGLGSDIGTFGVRITPVDGKINVNCAAGDNASTGLVVRAMQSLLYPPAFDPIFEEPDADGWRRDRRTQIAAIIDYIDTDQTRVDIRDDKNFERTGGGPEDYGYENLKDTYKAKNNKLDSVAELKLVRGVDDRFWTLFGNAFRVQGTCKVNLRGLDDPMVAAAVIALAADDKNDPKLRDFQTLWILGNLVIKAPQLGFYFTGEEGMDSFMQLVEDPVAILAQFAADPNGQGGGAAPLPAIPGMPQLPPGFKGIKLKRENLNQVAVTTPIANYQVEAWGEVTREPFLPARRTLRAFWNQEFQNQQVRNIQLTRKGAWLHLREE